MLEDIINVLIIQWNSSLTTSLSLLFMFWEEMSAVQSNGVAQNNLPNRHAAKQQKKWIQSGESSVRGFPVEGSEWTEFYTHTHTLLSFLIIRKLLFYSFFISEPSHLFLLHASTHSRCHLLLVFRSPPDLKTKPRFKEHEEKKPQSSSSPGPRL